MTLLPSSAPVTLAPRYAEFWHWFSQLERSFFHVVKAGERVHEDFFEKLAPALDRVKEGFYFQTGMFDDDTAELIITAEDVIEQATGLDLLSAVPGVVQSTLEARVDTGPTQ